MPNVSDLANQIWPFIAGRVRDMIRDNYVGPTQMPKNWVGRVVTDSGTACPSWAQGIAFSGSGVAITAAGSTVLFTSTGSASVTSIHDLDGVFHTGVLAGSKVGTIAASQVDGLAASQISGSFLTTQYPGALLLDGSRQLTGSLAVSSGITIDGVDLSDHRTRHGATGADNLMAISASEPSTPFIGMLWLVLETTASTGATGTLDFSNPDNSGLLVLLGL